MQGLAVSDLGRMIASPLGNIDRPRVENDASFAAMTTELSRIAVDRGVVGLVVGLPLLDGRPCASSQMVEGFVLRLCRASTAVGGRLAEAPLLLQDESFSTSEARARIRLASTKRSVLLRRKDAVAACVILQSVLEPDE